MRFNDEVPDFSLVERHIRRARELGAEVIIASVHWGWEFEMYPHRNIVQAGHRLAELGVDVILGSHPHVSQPGGRGAGGNRTARSPAPDSGCTPVLPSAGPGRPARPSP